MAKGKMPHRLGILTKIETEFLFMDENKKEKHVKQATARKNYERIVNSANQGFQDYAIMINRMPKHHLDKISFISGLHLIQRELTKKDLTEQIPHNIIVTTQKNLDDCISIISKEFDQRLAEIAKPDFEKIKKWLHLIQKYPKPSGAKTGMSM